MDCSETQWRPVAGFEGYYEVSRDGGVRSVDRVAIRRDGGQEKRRGQNLKLIVDADGYHVVNLVADGRRIRKKVHRLVLQSFAGGPPKDRAHINHINADRQDNRLENLEWCSPKENVRHAMKLGRMRFRRGVDVYNATLKAWQVRCIRQGDQVGWSIRDMADAFGVDYETVRLVARRKTYASVS